MKEITKEDLAKILDIAEDDGQEITEELLEEFFDGKGDCDDEQQQAR